MTDVQRLQQVLPENIRIGFVELDASGDDISILIRGSCIAPVRDLHNVVFDAAIRCFNLFTHAVKDRYCWRVDDVFEISIDLIRGKPWTVES